MTVIRLTQLLTALALCILLCFCGKNNTTDIEETAQQIGDVMASIDEAGGSGGTIAHLEKELRGLDRLPWEQSHSP